MLLHLLIHIFLAAQTRSRAAQRKTIRSIKRRQLVPRCNFDAAHSHTILPLLQDLHLLRNGRRRHVRRVKRREALLAVITRKQHHARQNRVHRLHCTQRRIAQVHVIFRNTDWEVFQRHDHVLLCNYSFLYLTIQIRVSASTVDVRTFRSYFYSPLLCPDHPAQRKLFQS